MPLSQPFKTASLSELNSRLIAQGTTNPSKAFQGAIFFNTITNTLYTNTSSIFDKPVWIAIQESTDNFIAFSIAL